MMDDMLEEAQNLRIEGSMLKGVLQDKDGGWRNAEIDLDQLIGNEDGNPFPIFSINSQPPTPSPYLPATASPPLTQETAG